MLRRASSSSSSSSSSAAVLRRLLLPLLGPDGGRSATAPSVRTSWSSSSSSSYSSSSSSSSREASTTTKRSFGEEKNSFGAFLDAKKKREDEGEEDVQQTTSFGYTSVPKTKKESLVREVFASVAPSYDVMNDLMSVGMHRLWKDYFVHKLAIFPGMTHLDVAGGTGDVSFRVLKKLRKVDREGTGKEAKSRVIVSDINPAMLKVGEKRAEQKGLKNPGFDTKTDAELEFVEANAEKLPFEDESVDQYTIAFGLRNVTNIDIALREAHRVLKKGGRISILEFSHVEEEPLKSLYNFYSFAAIPTMGQIVANDRKSYQYLVESIRKFPKQERLRDIMREEGFSSVDFENITGGIVAIHNGYKL
jgi:2-methoxy-6-polyprenyl-1,4-benzoquinol methylase